MNLALETGDKATVTVGVHFETLTPEKSLHLEPAVTISDGDSGPPKQIASFKQKFSGHVKVRGSTPVPVEQRTDRRG